MDRLRLPKRMVLVVALSLVAGAGAGLLSTLAGDGAARSVLYGFAAVGGAVQVLHLVLMQGRGSDRRGGRRPLCAKAEDRHG
ncbi:hypothetical protein ABZ848_03705 [Streptomyces sp. NPDC047081]|uniref:hypothetical protein n=1 Tax=Streptomyces sp. NPDC047081 TaxID=3154706 RepID=UPI0033D7F28D